MTTSNGGRQSRWALTRSRLAFVLGSGILVHEVAIHKGGDRPYILLAALALCGVASFLKLDDVLRGAGINIKLEKKEDPTEGEATPNGRVQGP